MTSDLLTDELSFQVDPLENFQLRVEDRHDAEQADFQQQQFQLNQAMKQLPLHHLLLQSSKYNEKENAI